MSLDRHAIRDFKHRDHLRIFKAIATQRRILGVLGHSSDERGRSAERNVQDVLDELKNEGKITHFYMAPKYSRLDRKGVDVVIFLLDGTKIERNIKSSQTGVEKHIEEQKQFKGKKIGAINGNGFPNMTHEEFKAMVYQNITAGWIGLNQ